MNAISEKTDMRFPVLAARINATSPDRIVERVLEMVAHRERGYINVCTVHTLLECVDNPALAAVVNGGNLAVPDGMPLVWLGRRAFPEAGVKRCYGPDLMLAVCEAGLGRKLRHCLYGGAPEVLELLERNLIRKFPGLQVVERISPPFRELTEAEKAGTAERINQAAPDVIWVGLGTPKQDLWMGEFRPKLNAPVLIAVGAAFNFHAGMLDQAPRWMQHGGLEWLYRLCKEPRRLWRRYLLGNPRFLWLLWRQRRSPLAGIGAGAAALVLLFHVYGVTVWKGKSGLSLFGWLYMMWSSESTEAVDYSHGMGIPLVSLWLLWRGRKTLFPALENAQPHILGAIWWAAAILMHFTGMRAQLPHLSALGFIIALWALVWSFAGREAAKRTLFPLAFLAFAIPIGFLAHATFPLRLFGSAASATILNGLGIATVRTGTAVYSTTGQGFAMDVADACSGIRSIMTLMALTAAYAYVFRKSNIERWFLFLMSVPIAAMANIGRIVTIAMAASFLGQEIGMKIYHDYSGYLVFVLAVALVAGTNALMDKAVGFLRAAHKPGKGGL